MNEFKIAVNKTAVNKAVPNMKYDKGFANIEATIEELRDIVLSGHPFTNIFKHEQPSPKNSPRCEANALEVNFLGLDFDDLPEGTTLQSMVDSDLFIEDYATMLYYTASHEPEAPRIRVLFVLSEPCTSEPGKTATNAYMGLKARYSKFPDKKDKGGNVLEVGAPFDKKNGYVMDTAPTNVISIFYGAKGTEVLMLWNRATLDPFLALRPTERKQAHREYQQTAVISPSNEADQWAHNRITEIVNGLGTAQAGERHTLGFQVAMQIHGLGAATWNSLNAESYRASFDSAMAQNGSTEKYGHREADTRWEEGKNKAEVTIYPYNILGIQEEPEKEQHQPPEEATPQTERNVLFEIAYNNMLDMTGLARLEEVRKMAEHFDCPYALIEEELTNAGQRIAKQARIQGRDTALSEFNESNKGFTAVNRLHGKYEELAREARGIAIPEGVPLSDVLSYFENKPGRLNHGFDYIPHFPRNAVTIILGETSRGKSTLLLNMFLNAIQNHPDERFYFLTFEEPHNHLIAKSWLVDSGKKWEMTREQDVKYLGSKYSYLEYYAGHGRKKGSPNGWIENAMENYKDLVEDKRLAIVKLPINDTGVFDVLRALAERKDTGAVFIDYIQIVPLTSGLGTRQLELKRFVNGLKDITSDEKNPITVIAASQLNDAGKVREARDILFDANVALEISAVSEVGENKKVVRVWNQLKVTKNRDGQRGQRIVIDWDKPNFKMSYGGFPKKQEDSIDDFEAHEGEKKRVESQSDGKPKKVKLD